MATPGSRLNNEEYLNWLRGSLSLLFLKEGIEAFTDKRVADFHERLKEIVSQQPGHQQAALCNTCTDYEVQRYKNTWRVKCSSNTCNTWLKQILRFHADGINPNLAHTKLKPQLWPSQPWEVAKCFLPQGNENLKSAKDADVAAVLKLMKSCHFMQTFMDPGVVQEVLDVRHRLMHSNSITTCDDQLQRDTDTIIKMLKSMVDLTQEESDSAQRSIESINKLRDKTLDVTLSNEVIVMTSRMHAVEGELACLRDKCKDYETVRKDLTKTSGELQSLDEELRETKAEIDKLKETKDRFDDFLQKNDLVCDVANLSKRIDEHGHTFGLQLARIVQLEDRLDQQDERLGQQDDRLDKQEVRQGQQDIRIDQQAQTIDQQGQILDQRLSIVEENMKSKDESAACESTCSWEEHCKGVQQYLLEMYNTKCSWENPMTTDQQCVLDMYVPPAVKVTREKDEYGGLEEVKKEESQPSRLSYGQIFSSRSGQCTNVYITGDAGTGKTTFCKQMALTWCMAVKNVQDGKVSPEDLAILSTFKFLFYINLRDTETLYHVEEMIKKQLLHYAPISIDVSALLRKEKCLIVLDGLDEWSCPNDVEKCPGVNKHIPGRNIMKKNCVYLTTTRSWKYDVSDLKTKDVDKYVEFSGIDQNSSEELAQKLVDYLDRKSKRQTNIVAFNTEIRQKKLTDLITVPVLLIQLVSLWHYGKDFGNSQLQLYCSMLDLLFERSEKKLSEKESESTCKIAEKGTNVQKGKQMPKFFSTKDYCQSHAGLILCLAELAYKSLFNKQREEALVFKSSKLDIFGISPSDINHCLQCGILSQNKDFENYTGSYKKLSFLHKKMQEFLAALHIVTAQSVNNNLKCVREFCNSIDILIEMSQVWLFVCGMSPDIARQLLKHFTDVITADTDKQIQKYRQSLCGEGLIRDIQTFVADCLTEGENNGHTYDTIGLEDLYIDRHTFSHVERALLGNVTSCIKSMYITSGHITVDQSTLITGLLLHSQAVQKLYLNDYESRITRETLTPFLHNCSNTLTCIELDSRVTLTESGVTSICHSISECLMALRLFGVSLTHVDIVKLLNGLSQSHNIRHLELWLHCTDHVLPGCRPRIDMSTMTQLQTLRLWFICVDNLPTVTQCLEWVDLWHVILPMAALCEFARRISQTKRYVDVKLYRVTVREEREDRVDLVTFLRGCPGLTVTDYQYYDWSNTWQIFFHTNKQ